METVEGFSPAFKANIVFGADWLSFDPDQEHARINLKGVAKTDKGHSISFGYKGVIALVEDVKKVFNMQPGMATVPFGYA
ncbi:hypothetical protein MMC24_000205, partial [Lignoscripta atroalba]|nr:hypothetical protein [Lignoscripta atroalba]